MPPLPEKGYKKSRQERRRFRYGTLAAEVGLRCISLDHSDFRSALGSSRLSVKWGQQRPLPPRWGSREGRVRDARNSLAAGKRENTRLLSSWVGAAAETHLDPKKPFERPSFCRALTKCHSHSRLTPSRLYFPP